MNQIKPINNPLDRQGRNDFNHNFGVLDKRTKATNQTIETLVVESGTSDAETILARNGEKSLKARLDKTDAYIDRQDEQILLQAQRYADTLGLDGNVSVDDLESIVFKDDYQAEWEKNLKDYDKLKYGAINFMSNDYSKYVLGVGTTVKDNKIQKVNNSGYAGYYPLKRKDIYPSENNNLTISLSTKLLEYTERKLIIRFAYMLGETIVSHTDIDSIGQDSLNQVKRHSKTIKWEEKEFDSVRLFLLVPESKIEYWDIKIEPTDFVTPFTVFPEDINAQQLSKTIAQDIYQAKEGNWIKSTQDYEELKLGKVNILPTSRTGVPLEFWASGRNNMFNYTHNKEYVEFTINSDLNAYSIPINGRTEYNTHSVYINVTKPCKGNAYTISHQPLAANRWIRLQHTHTNTRFFLNLIDVQEGTKVHLKLLKVENSEKFDLPSPWTPSPEEIGASPFIVKLAQDYYNQQQEINELRNAILTLGGK